MLRLLCSVFGWSLVLNVQLCVLHAVHKRLYHVQLALHCLPGKGWQVCAAPWPG